MFYGDVGYTPPAEWKYGYFIWRGPVENFFETLYGLPEEDLFEQPAPPPAAKSKKKPTAAAAAAAAALASGDVPQSKKKGKGPAASAAVTPAAGTSTPASPQGANGTASGPSAAPSPPSVSPNGDKTTGRDPSTQEGNISSDFQPVPPVSRPKKKKKTGPNTDIPAQPAIVSPPNGEAVEPKLKPAPKPRAKPTGEPATNDAGADTTAGGEEKKKKKRAPKAAKGSTAAADEQASIAAMVALTGFTPVDHGISPFNKKNKGPAGPAPPAATSAPASGTESASKPTTADANPPKPRVPHRKKVKPPPTDDANPIPEGTTTPAVSDSKRKHDAAGSQPLSPSKRQRQAPKPPTVKPDPGPSKFDLLKIAFKQKCKTVEYPDRATPGLNGKPHPVLPHQLRPDLFELVREALRVNACNEILYAFIAELVPGTTTAIIKRFMEHNLITSVQHDNLRLEIGTRYDELKAAIDAQVRAMESPTKVKPKPLTGAPAPAPVSGGESSQDGSSDEPTKKRARWTDQILHIFSDVIAKEAHLAEVQNQSRLLRGKDPLYTERGVRKAVYAKVMGFWPEDYDSKNLSKCLANWRYTIREKAAKAAGGGGGGGRAGKNQKAAAVEGDAVDSGVVVGPVNDGTALVEADPPDAPPAPVRPSPAPTPTPAPPVTRPPPQTPTPNVVAAPQHPFPLPHTNSSSARPSEPLPSIRDLLPTSFPPPPVVASSSQLNGAGEG
ncbi:hypothetical protein BDK51DRAFT_34920 [Blyttiomyces helicus]|uniref:Ubinuclein middle domain-containing protein n=1 Tax=Blyttiomyces helicus TaxID=388810 RepID=A0A4P9WDW8_9FUNG|nr:hypothetical protein BDK51DRAFT_34920 [Blyttiomyces helicus]|eukprot:RKO89873.1 hypothetical protein BDK51DRAFT_34920 [Blyttiomyces helicus]